MNKEVGHIIRNRRKDLSITQSELASRINCNYATICAIEKGNSVAFRYILDALDVLGLEIKIEVKTV